jgi:hypothetical protein
MVVMLLVSFFSWWYGRGWAQVATSFSSRLGTVADTFSTTQLLQTLFAPWRRIITYPGASLGERMRAWGDNVFSRLIGFIVRFFVLLAALIAAIGTIIFTTIEVLVWPILPLAIVGFIIAGVVL